MKSLTIAFLIVLMLGTVSCDPAEKYKSQISEIDSCLVLLDSMEAQYSGIEFDSLKMMVHHVVANEDSIHKYYNPDTLSLDIGIKMNESKGVRKKLRDVEVQRSSFDKEFPATRKQLTNLKTDITNGVLSEEKVKQYVKEEKDAFNKLNLAFKKFYTMQEAQKAYYYSAVPVIDEFIEQIKNEAKQEE